MVTSYQDRISRATGLLREAHRVTAFTGAGISTESGISDFRSPGGIWERYRIVTYDEFLSDRDRRTEYWRMKNDLFQEMRGAGPNRAHRALAGMERAGKLTCLITQNIDGLHQDAGSMNVLELHGTNRKAVCLTCGKMWPIEDVQARLERDGFDPHCDACQGLIKPATVSFGQAMPQEEMEKALFCATQCEVFLMIGSSLQVEPAASIPRAAHRAGARLIYVNRTETPSDHLAHVLFREEAGAVLSHMLRDLTGR